MKSEKLSFLEPSGPLQACNGTVLPLPYYIYYTSTVTVNWHFSGHFLGMEVMCKICKSDGDGAVQRTEIASWDDDDTNKKV